MGSREKDKIQEKPRMGGAVYVLLLAEERVQCEPEQSQSGALGLEVRIVTIRIIITIAPTVLSQP